MTPPYVTNAGDRDQVAAAKRVTDEQRRRFQRALRGVMSTPEGRLVMYRLLEVAGVFRSIWAPNAEVHYRAGRQDYGHELMTELAECDGEGLLYLEMEREARTRAKSDEQEVAAARTRRSDETRSRDD